MSDLTANIKIQVLDGFSSPLSKFGGKLEEVGRKAKTFADHFKIAADLNQAAEGMGRFADGVTNMLRQPIKDFASFEARMSEVGAISGTIGTEAFGKLTKQAADLGAATSYSGEEAAAAMASLARAGRNANEIMGITPTILSLAKASGEGLASTADILGGAMSGMGLDAAQSARTADILAIAFTHSATTLGGLGESLKMVGPLAKQAGMSLEDTTALIGALGNAGIKGTEAGTGLRAALSRLINPAGESEKALSKLGFAGEKLTKLQASIANGDIAGALASIGAASSKLPDAKRLEMLSQIFGQEAISSATVLIDATMDPSSKGFAALRKELGATDNRTAKLAKIMEDNLAGSMERAGGAVSGLSTKIGAALAPSVARLADSIGVTTDAVGEWVDKNPKATSATLQLVGGLAALAVGSKAVLLTASAYNAMLGMSGALYAQNASILSAKTWGLAAAAGAAGFAVGTWANETFDLANKISTLLGRPSSAGPSSLKEGGTYADGTSIGADGSLLNRTVGGTKFLNPLTADSPAVIKRAYASGAKSFDEVQDFVRREYTMQRRATKGQQPGEGSVLSGAAPTMMSDVETSSQMPELVRALKSSEATQAKMLKELEKANRSPVKAP